MTRCITCRDFIWPWQHYGFRVKADGRQVRWHTGHKPEGI